MSQVVTVLQETQVSKVTISALLSQLVKHTVCACVRASWCPWSRVHWGVLRSKKMCVHASVCVCVCVWHSTRVGAGPDSPKLSEYPSEI